VVEAIYLEVKLCVDEVKAACSFWPCVPDGWTAPNGDFMMNNVELMEGVPFYSFQANPQGEKCDAVWMLKVLKESLMDPKCSGVCADNCSTMQDFKAAFQDARGSNGCIIFAANCSWHGIQSIASAITNAGGGVATADHVLKMETGPAAERWSLDGRNPESLPSVAKAIVKIFKGRQRPRGLLRTAQRNADKLAVVTWQEAISEMDADSDKPPRPRKLQTLKLPGATRALSIINPLVSVFENREPLDTVVRSKEWDAFIGDQPNDKKKELEHYALVIKQSGAGVNPTLVRFGEAASFLGILQRASRVLERRRSNLSDAVDTWVRLYDEILLQPSPMMTVALRERARAAVRFRGAKIFTPSMALAAVLDPRRRFNVTGVNFPGISVDLAVEARAFLEKCTKVLNTETRNTVLAQYNKLVGTGKSDGSAYDALGADAELLLEADTMPLQKWWETHRRTSVTTLSMLICEPLFSIPAAQASVEQLNSAAARLIEGRIALKTDKAQKLLYIYQNVRAVKEFWEARKAANAREEPFSRRLGAGWPPSGVRLTLDGVNADYTPDLAAVLEKSTLAAAIRSLEQGDEEEAVAHALAQGNAKAKPGGAAAKPSQKPAGKGGKAGKRKRSPHSDSEEGEETGEETDGGETSGSESDSDDEDF
jgi:hypothetical protein